VNTQPPADNSTYRRPGKDEAKADDKTGKEDTAKTPAEKRAEAAKKAESDKLKQEMCAEARETLRTLEESPRVRTEDKEGNVSYLNEDEVAKRKKAEQERVGKYCK
ncbi:MAG: hypothetical protein QG652_1751, partial [Pseudomonadota bacterium]|nr:hypothetical protein [Pseudomonadota bacterium]